jgi:protein-L-isoaspartate(D-aspartate) O-methyltransferase
MGETAMFTLIKTGAMFLVSAVVSSAITATASAQKADQFAAARQQMIERDLKGRDITNPAVLKAMEDVPRHRFVPSGMQDQAYADCPLPIGHGQTISQPYVVAFMTQMLEVRPDDKILEIGTGCGYQAAVLARLAQQVYTIEIVKPLADEARKLLTELGYKNIFIKAGDGFEGWSEHAPFNKIILTCAVEEIPPALIEQLKEGGRIIAPIGATYELQQLVIATKKAGTLTYRQVLPVRFVPMTGKALED